MQVIICYDVSSNKLRTKLVNYLEKFSVRVQYSVFKANLSDQKIEEVLAYSKRLLREDDYKFNIYKIWESCNKEDDVKLPSHYLVL